MNIQRLNERPIAKSDALPVAPIRATWVKALLCIFVLAWSLLQTLGFIHHVQHMQPQTSASQQQAGALWTDHTAGSDECKLLDILCAADLFQPLDAAFILFAFVCFSFILCAAKRIVTQRHWRTLARGPPSLN